MSKNSLRRKRKKMKLLLKKQQNTGPTDSTTPVSPSVPQSSLHPDSVSNTSEQIDLPPPVLAEQTSVAPPANKIQLQKNSHSYVSVFYRKYGKYLHRYKKPILIVLRFFTVVFGLFALFVISLFLTFGRDLPDIRKLKDMNFSETTHIYDRAGNELYRIFGKENREYVKLPDISPDIIHATIAIEDKSFYRHFGFDPVGMVRAQLKNIQDDSISQGASTITQQLAKNIFLSSERTLDRKIKELLLSVEIEWYFEKDEILEMYFNKIAYGSNSFGVEAASQTFFGIPAKNVNLVQASVLASLPKGPSLFSPYGPNVKELMGYCNDPQNQSLDSSGSTLEQTQEVSSPAHSTAAKVSSQESTQEVPSSMGTCTSPFDPNYVFGRKDYVLDRMVEDRYITKDQMIQAWKDGLTLKFIDPKYRIDDPHFVFYVKDYLTQKYGKDLVENGGLRVTTTLDPVVQKTAQDAIDHHVDLIRRYGANNAAMVALDPKTGQVLAMIGSKDYWDEKIDGQVNVTLSARQPGSAFKPLVYAAAIQNAGIGSGTVLADHKTVFNKNNVPNNYDGRFLGAINIRSAIGGSRNIPAIKAFYVGGGEEKILEFVEKLGLVNLRQFRDEFNKDADKRGWTFFFGWPMAIGSGEVRLLDLTNAYATFANHGKYNAPNPILEVRDRDGNVLESHLQETDPGKQVIDPQVAYIISDILSDVRARPAGSWRWLLTIPGHTLAAKTGTSNKRIGWMELPNNNLTMGYTPFIAAGFWVGNTDGKQLYNSAYSLYTTDPIYHEFFDTYLKDKPDVKFVKPEGIKTIRGEYYPSWGGQKSFESMFKKIDDDSDAAKKKKAKHGAADTATPDPSSPFIPQIDPLVPDYSNTKTYKQTLDKVNQPQVGIFP